jgi:hypothetical protein
MDGNSSAKRRDGYGSADPRIFTSKYHITPNIVDRFKNEVQSGPNRRDPDCTSQYKVANTIDNPSALDPFDQTGIFILTCRHHIVELLLEMKKSGEL